MIDQYYTNEKLAEKLASEVSRQWASPDVLFIEPSAGTGVFVDPLRNLNRKIRAIDIEPKNKFVSVGDFLSENGLFSGQHESIVVIGNPPFGKNASLAVRFFNRAAIHADEIAFIVPRTFRKASVQNRLDRHFHINKDITLGDDAFIFNDLPYDVPCAWQVWARQNNKRPLIKAPNIDHLIEFLSSPDEAEFAMRRVGYYAGRIISNDLHSLSKSTHYFMREKICGIRDFLAAVDWVEITSQTAGVRSLSKTELAFKVAEGYDA